MGLVTPQEAFDTIQGIQLGQGEIIGRLQQEVNSLKKTVEVLDKVRTGKPIYINVAEKTEKGLD